MVREPRMSPNNSKAIQVKQNDWETTLWSQSAWTELYFSCFSCLFWWYNILEQGGRQRVSNPEKLSLWKWPFLASWQGFTSLFQRTASSLHGLYVYLLKMVNKEHPPLAETHWTWVICKRRHESYFEHFWSAVLQRTILQFYVVIYIELNVNRSSNSMIFKNWALIPMTDWSASRNTKICQFPSNIFWGHVERPVSVNYLIR